MHTGYVVLIRYGGKIATGPYTLSAKKIKEIESEFDIYNIHINRIINCEADDKYYFNGKATKDFTMLHNHKVKVHSRQIGVPTNLEGYFEFAMDIGRNVGKISPGEMMQIILRKFKSEFHFGLGHELLRHTNMLFMYTKTDVNVTVSKLASDGMDTMSAITTPYNVSTPIPVLSAKLSEMEISPVHESTPMQISSTPVVPALAVSSIPVSPTSTTPTSYEKLLYVTELYLEFNEESALTRRDGIVNIHLSSRVTDSFILEMNFKSGRQSPCLTLFINKNAGLNIIEKNIPGLTKSQYDELYRKKYIDFHCQYAYSAIHTIKNIIHISEEVKKILASALAHYMFMN
jgi:hypothetical protein